MAKIIFEADDNRKGIVDKIFVINKQMVHKGDKIANIVTQNKVYEIKAPIRGEVQNLIVYENKVINSGDTLLDLVSFNDAALDEQNYSSEQTYNTISNGSGKYNAHNKPPIDIKKSETEIFREELIETLLAREVAGENPEDEFDDGDDSVFLEEQATDYNQPLSQKNNENEANSSLLKDKVEEVIDNIPSEDNIETLQKDLGDLKEDLVTVKEDLAAMTIHEEIIEDIENLECDLAFTTEINGKKSVDNEISVPLQPVAFAYDPKYKQEDNEKVTNLVEEPAEIIYFDEKLVIEATTDGEPTVLLPEVDAETISKQEELEQHNDNSTVVNEPKMEPVVDPNLIEETKKDKDKGEDVKIKGADVETKPKSHLPKETFSPEQQDEDIKVEVAKKTEKPPVKTEPLKELQVKKPEDKVIKEEEHQKTEKPLEKHAPKETHSKKHAAAEIKIVKADDEEKPFKPHTIKEPHAKKHHDESVKTKKHREHSKTHATVHSPAASHIKKHDGEDEKTAPHANSLKHKVKESNARLEADQIKLSKEAMERAKEILASKKSNTHSFIDIEVDVTELVSLLSIIQEAYLQNEIELTVLPFYIKAVYDGLKRFPILNASFISKDYEILLKWYYNIAISVDIDSDDTVVKMPVLYNLQDSSIKDIALKVTSLIHKTTNNELAAADYQDASFSIVNYGEYGITKGTFTIPEDNVAGIAMGIIFKKPVVVDKNDITIRDIMVITLGYNDAVINVTKASEFVHYVAYLLSNPGLLL